MKLGWSVLLVASMIAVTGPLVAVLSIRLDPSAAVFDWPARQFLLIMYSDCAVRGIRCGRSAQPQAAPHSPSHDASGQPSYPHRSHWPYSAA
jgi:hypothetical protein